MFKNTNSHGIVIPEGSNILGLGVYLKTRGMIRAENNVVEQLDGILSGLSENELKLLGNVLVNSGKVVKQVYEYNRNHPGSGKAERDAQMVAVGSSNYGTYVSDMSIRRITPVEAISQLAQHNSLGHIPVQYESGISKVQLSGEYVMVKDAIDTCKGKFINDGIKVEVKPFGAIEEYASKIFPDPTLKEQFIKDGEKRVGSISLVKLGSVSINCQFTGSVSQDDGPKSMSDTFKAHICSPGKELNAYYKDGNEVQRGTVLKESNHFFSYGLDTTGLNLKKPIAESIFKSKGLDYNKEDSIARLEFEKFLTIHDEKDLPPYLLFNLSWISEDMKFAKFSSKRAVEFEDKYANMLKYVPTYVGSGSYKFVLNRSDEKDPLKPSYFLMIFNIVEKIMAYYVFACSVKQPVELKSFLVYFFYRNRHDDIKRVVYKSLEFALGKYNFSIPFQSVKSDKGEVWGADTSGNGQSPVEEIQGTRWFAPLTDIVSYGDYRSSVITAVDRNIQKFKSDGEEGRFQTGDTTSQRIEIRQVTQEIKDKQDNSDGKKVNPYAKMFWDYQSILTGKASLASFHPSRAPQGIIALIMNVFFKEKLDAIYYKFGSFDDVSFDVEGIGDMISKCFEYLEGGGFEISGDLQEKWTFDNMEYLMAVFCESGWQ